MYFSFIGLLFYFSNFFFVYFWAPRQDVIRQNFFVSNFYLSFFTRIIFLCLINLFSITRKNILWFLRFPRTLIEVFQIFVADFRNITYLLRKIHFFCENNLFICFTHYIIRACCKFYLYTKHFLHFFISFLLLIWFGVNGVSRHWVQWYENKEIKADFY